MRLIDGDALIARLKPYKDKYGADKFPYDIVHDAFIYEVEKEPTIEVVPLRHAKLIDPQPYGRCSICDELIDIRDEFNYCPHCGAKLDLKED